MSAYPPPPHREQDPANIAALVKAYPFAHFFTGAEGMRVTRIPFAAEFEGGALKRLRAHLHGQNPQSERLNGALVLVAFSGPDTYVSPNWRTASDRGATWDYTAVHVWGRARVRTDRAFFDHLIGDLASAAEARHAGLSDKPAWSMKNVTEDYVERLRPRLCAFEVEVSRIEAIAKLHQNFPEADARSVAAHLARSPNEGSRAAAGLIAERLTPAKNLL
jgi:transcriptional regulator